MKSRMLKLISKEMQFVETSWVSKLFLRRQRWLNVRAKKVELPSRLALKRQRCLTIKAKKINWSSRSPLSRRLCLAVKADNAKWDFKPFFRQLLCSAMAGTGLIFCHFCIFFAWELLSYDVRTCLARFLFYNTYQVGQRSCSFP